MTMSESIPTLYIEELKGTMRGRFAWIGAAIVLLAVGGLATVGTQDTWLDGYGIIAYALVPLGFIPVAAGMIASPRINRFVKRVFTAAVKRRDWLAAKCLGLMIGVLFIGRSLAAPADAGRGVLLAFAGLMPLQELMPEQQLLGSGRKLVAVTHSLRQRSHPA